MQERIRTHPLTPEQITHNQEMTRRQEWRNKYLVPIYIMWTSNVHEDLAEAAKLGVVDALRASRQQREVLVFGSAPFTRTNGPFSSPDWYIQEALKRQHLKRNAGHGPQVDVREVTRLFAEEPYQEQPHWEVFIVNYDLNVTDNEGKYLNFVFGSTNTLFVASVQSVKRLIDSGYHHEFKKAMARRLLRHEVGHMFGSTTRSTNVEYSLGSHCASPICTMKQGLSLPEWAKHTQNEVRTNIQFCNDCLTDLAKRHSRFSPMPS